MDFLYIWGDEAVLLAEDMPRVPLAVPCKRYNGERIGDLLKKSSSVPTCGILYLLVELVRHDVTDPPSVAFVSVAR
jgi:hypothetical protein